MRIQSPRLTPYAWSLAAFWVIMVTIIMATSLIWNINRQEKETIKLATIEAKTVYEKNLTYHRWASRHDGVFVPITEKTQPNPYLTQIPGTIIETTEDEKLTLINPEYMLRQVYEMQNRKFEPVEHITSLDPVRPENAADRWETSALKAFEEGRDKVVSVEEINGAPYLRYMRPMITEKGCLKCHAVQGYEVGDIRGGISVSIPLAPLRSIAREETLATTTGHVALWSLALAGILLGSYWLTINMRERENIEARTRAIIDNMFDGLITVDRQKAIKTFNPAASRLFSYEPDEIIGKSIYTLFTLPEEGTGTEEINGDFLGNDFIRVTDAPYELIGRRKDGSTFPVEISLSETQQAGDHLTIAMVRDLTGRKEAEKALRESQKHLIKQEKLASLGTMVAGIAHEINNPAQAIGFSMEGLEMSAGYVREFFRELRKCLDSDSEDLPAKREELIKLLREMDMDLVLENLEDIAQRNSESVLRISKIIKSTKRLAHFEDDFTETDLNTVVNDALTLTRNQVKYDISIEVDLAPDLPTFRGLPQELGQVCINLIINARDAMKEKGLTQSEALLFISTGYDEETKYLEARFRDNGVGIREETMSKIFDPFFTTKGFEVGTGLGLNLSHMIVEAHGGWIKVESEYGEGATFTVMLNTDLPSGPSRQK